MHWLVWSSFCALWGVYGMRLCKDNWVRFYLWLYNLHCTLYLLHLSYIVLDCFSLWLYNCAVIRLHLVKRYCNATKCKNQERKSDCNPIPLIALGQKVSKDKICTFVNFLTFAQLCLKTKDKIYKIRYIWELLTKSFMFLPHRNL